MASETPERLAYGEHPQQFGELRRPTTSPPTGTGVLLQRGFWRTEVALDYVDPLAADLAARGATVWSLEYRRNGEGPWPATLADVAAGIDHLATLDVDTARVVVIGHSAGGHLATWAAGRAASAAGTVGASPTVRVRGAVSLAGAVDLDRGARTGMGDRATQEFLGGEPGEVPDHYALADPVARLPIGVPVRCVHGTDDVHVPHEQSVRYVEAATAAGDDATLDTVDGDHFVVVDPENPAWDVVVARIAELTGS